MNMLRLVAELPLAHALGWTLIHFCWQGSVIGLALLIALGVVRRSAPMRYAACCGALFLMMLLPILTFVRLAAEPAAFGSLIQNLGVDGWVLAQSKTGRSSGNFQAGGFQPDCLCERAFCHEASRVGDEPRPYLYCVWPARLDSDDAARRAGSCEAVSNLALPPDPGIWATGARKRMLTSSLSIRVDVESTSCKARGVSANRRGATPTRRL